MYLLALEVRIYEVFDNLFDLNNRDEQLVTGLNKELNSVYVYDYFNKYNNNILLVTNSLYEANDLYNRLSNYTDRVLFFLWMIL